VSNVSRDHVNIFRRQPHHLPSHIHRRMHRIPNLPHSESEALVLSSKKRAPLSRAGPLIQASS
jgi:hypothetical protein